MTVETTAGGGLLGGVQTDSWSVGVQADDLGWGFTSRAKWRSPFPGPKVYNVNISFLISMFRLKSFDF